IVVVSSWPVETARLKRIPLSACSSAEKAEPEWEIQATFPGSRSARSSKARARSPPSMSRNPIEFGPADGHTSFGRDAPEPLGQGGVPRLVLERPRENDDAPCAPAGRL